MTPDDPARVQIAEPSYRVLSGDPGIFLEVYLPKRTQYQHILYESLTEGFRLDSVRTYLSEHKQEVGQFFEVYGARPSLLDLHLDADFDPMYRGYSMYEVDGVFAGVNQAPIEERTQVIRMMFRLDTESLTEKFHLPRRVIQQIARIFFRNQSSRVNVVRWHYEMQHKASGEGLSEAEDRFLRYLSTWHDQVTLFVFGYLVRRLCDRIRGMYTKGEIDHVEQEIWVTAFWNMNLNRVVDQTSAGALEPYR